MGVDFTIDGREITIFEDAAKVKCTYKYKIGTPTVRVQKHLGTENDPVDAYLNGLFPDKWTATAVLRGFCYTVVTLDLNQSEFQGGIPTVEVLLRGKKLFDPRTGLTGWSQNNALVAYDYLTGEVCGVDSSDIPLAQLITAANVCDEQVSIGSETASRYTFNGSIWADEAQSSVLEKIAQSMAGGLVSTSWEMWAGKWVAPVAAFDQSDIVGELSIVPGVSVSELYNGVKGQYIGVESKWVATDITPYQNATYAITDGKDLWTDIEFTYTDEIQRCWNLARIFVEDQRHGFTVKAEFGLKAWPVKVGQRITLDSAFFGWEG